jgi:hypothetical protein
MGCRIGAVDITKPSTPRCNNVCAAARSALGSSLVVATMTNCPGRRRVRFVEHRYHGVGEPWNDHSSALRLTPAVDFCVRPTGKSRSTLPPPPITC